MTKMLLTVVRLSNVHNIEIDRITKEGHFFTAYKNDQLVAGFSCEAIDEFYVRVIEGKPINEQKK